MIKTVSMSRYMWTSLYVHSSVVADVRQLEEHQFVESVQEQVEAALLEYTLCTSAHLLGRFAHLLLCLSELRSLSSRAEDYLYCKHLSGEVPCNSLLIEMLHAKHSWP